MIPIGDVPLRPVTQTNLPPGVIYKTWNPTPDEEEDMLRMRQMSASGISIPLAETPDQASFWGGMTPGVPWELQGQVAKPEIKITGPSPTMANVRKWGESVTVNASGSPDERQAARPVVKAGDISQYRHLDNLAHGGAGDTGPFERNAWIRRDYETPNGMWIYSEWEPGKVGFKFFPKKPATTTGGTTGNNFGFPRMYYGGGGGGGGYSAPQKPWYMDLMTWKIG